MRIEPNRAAVVARARAGRGAATSAGGFESHIGQARGPQGSSASALDSVANLESVLLLNDIAEREEPDMAARRDASAILDGLDEIRHGLLQGRLSRRVLVELERTVGRDKVGISDPALRELYDAITLRARVELAKLARTA